MMLQKLHKNLKDFKAIEIIPFVINEAQYDYLLVSHNWWSCPEIEFSGTKISPQIGNTNRRINATREFLS